MITIPSHELFVQWIDTATIIWQEELLRPIPSDMLAAWVEAFSVGATGEDMRANLRASEEWALKHPTAPPAPGPVEKTPEEMMAVRCDFLNRWDKHGNRYFGPWLAAQPVDVQVEWLQTALGEGDTHYVISVDVNLTRGNPSGRIVNFYTAGLWGEFRAAMLRIVERGLTPIVFFHSGDSYPGDGYFHGITAWFRQHCGDLIRKCLLVCGWETVNGGYRSSDFNRCNLIISDALHEGIMAFHGSQGRGGFGSYNSAHGPLDENGCELDDPWRGKSEDACWKSECGPRMDVFLYQVVVARDNEVDEFGQPQWWDRALDTCERFLPPGTAMPGAVGLKMRDRQGNVTTRDGYAGGPKGAIWFPAGNAPVLVAFEYQDSDHPGPARAAEMASWMYSIGFRNFGSGQ